MLSVGFRARIGREPIYAAHAALAEPRRLPAAPVRRTILPTSCERMPDFRFPLVARQGR